MNPAICRRISTAVKMSRSAKNAHGDDQGHEKDNAAHHVVLRVLDVRIGAGLDAEGRAGMFHENVPATLGHRGFGHVQVEAGPAVQHVQTLVFDGVFLHLLLPGFVQGPHVTRGQKGGARKRPVGERGVTLAPGDFFTLGARRIQQQEADADVAGARRDAAGPHGDLDPLARTL